MSWALAGSIPLPTLHFQPAMFGVARKQNGSDFWTEWDQWTQESLEVVRQRYPDAQADDVEKPMYTEVGADGSVYIHTKDGGTTILPAGTVLPFEEWQARRSIQQEQPRRHKGLRM